jgi:ferric-dicitrate binding protein FerR (iron transport regulator)
VEFDSVPEKFGSMTEESDSMPEEFDSVAEEMNTQVITMRPARRRWVGWTAAAAVVLLISFGAYWTGNRKNEKPTIAAVSKVDLLPPSAIRATITLANGQKVFLDSAGHGTLAVQGNVRVIKIANGQIVYNGSALPASGSHMVYNTLSNPRGSKAVSLTLSDGTSVWLNSESSLTYPADFIGAARNVTITGEAYFEVTKNIHMPFTITKGETTITVLGTHFNVNAYPDEKNLEVTLLEGSVKVTQGNVSDLLRPGQQAQIGKDIKVVTSVDLDEVMAWKNDKFLFGEKTDIATIMRQLARWYDVDVEYQGTVSQHFWGAISRNVNASKVFEMLETTGGAHFKIEGKKVTVMP